MVVQGAGRGEGRQDHKQVRWSMIVSGAEHRGHILGI